MGVKSLSALLAVSDSRLLPFVRMSSIWLVASRPVRASGRSKTPAKVGSENDATASRSVQSLSSCLRYHPKTTPRASPSWLISSPVTSTSVPVSLGSPYKSSSPSCSGPSMDMLTPPPKPRSK